jgi:hypothetical protein
VCRDGDIYYKDVFGFMKTRNFSIILVTIFVLGGVWYLEGRIYGRNIDQNPDKATNEMKEDNSDPRSNEFEQSTTPTQEGVGNTNETVDSSITEENAISIDANEVKKPEWVARAWKDQTFVDTAESRVRKIAQDAAQEIAERLELSEAQHTFLTETLQEKSVVELRLIMSDEYYTEKFLQLEKYQYEIETKIRNEFNSNAILEYEQFEVERAQKLHKKQLDNALARMLNGKDYLSDAQRQQITQAIYSIDLPPNAEFSIGIYGTQFEDFRNMVMHGGWYREELQRVRTGF